MTNTVEQLGQTYESIQPKKILLLGSGFVAQPCAEYVLRRPENSLTIGELRSVSFPCHLGKTISLIKSTTASARIDKAKALAALLPREVSVAQVDACSTESLDALVSQHDLVVSLIPFTYHINVIKSAIRFKKHVVTTSYVSDAMKALEEDVKEAGIVVMNEIGFDPGLDHLYAVKTIDDVHKAGGKVGQATL